MGKNAGKEVEQGISNIIGSLTDPIIVFPGGWGESLPDWLKDTITLERMLENMKALHEEKLTATDAEACAYLFTASLTRPIGEQWTRIYLYVSTQVCRRWKRVDLPADIIVDSISDEETQELNGLKDFIYERRLEHRKGVSLEERRREPAARERTEEANSPNIKFF